MWFLYMIAWLYAITPILRKFVNHDSLKYVKYFILLGLMMFFTRPLVQVLESFLPFNTSFLSWLDNFHADFVGGFTVYYITGWYLHNYKIRKRIVYALYALSALSIIVIILLANVLPSEQLDLINANDSLLIFLYSTGMYLWLQRAVFPAWAGNLAPYVFGIYIIHPILIFLFNTYAEYANTATIYVIKWVVVSLLSIVVAIMFSKVKYFNQIVKA